MFEPIHQIGSGGKQKRPYWIKIAVAASGLCLAATANGADRQYDVIRDQVYVERESGPLKADIYVPHGDGPFPAMLVVHGGAWSMGTRTQLAGAAQRFAENGYTAVAISYRLAPQYQFPAQIYDCQAAVRWLRSHAAEFKADPKRIGGFGYSAGGQLVALLGSLDDDDFVEPGVAADAPSARLQVVLAGGAPCELRVFPIESRKLAYWLGGTPGEKPAAYQQASPTSYVTSDDPPMFFFHGAEDEVVPIRSPRRMVEVLQEAHVTTEFYEVPKAGHIAAALDREAMEHARAFADRYLKSGPAEVGAEERPARSDGGEDAPARAPIETSQNAGGANGQ